MKERKKQTKAITMNLSRALREFKYIRCVGWPWPTTTHLHAHSDCRVFRYVMGSWLPSLCMWAREHFSHHRFCYSFLSTSNSPFYKQKSRRCADWAGRRLKDGQPKHRRSFSQSQPLTGWIFTGSQLCLQKQLRPSEHTVFLCHKSGRKSALWAVGKTSAACDARIRTWRILYIFFIV